MSWLGCKTWVLNLIIFYVECSRFQHHVGIILVSFVLVIGKEYTKSFADELMLMYSDANVVMCAFCFSLK